MFPLTYGYYRIKLASGVTVFRFLFDANRELQAEWVEISPMNW
jgi:hypothetical protein